MSTTQRKSKNTNPSSDAKENLEHNNSTAQYVVEPKTENKNDNFCAKNVNSIRKK
jgi:hypothetical protein